MAKVFKIGTTPPRSAHPDAHADFLELECLRQSDGNASGGDLIAALKRVDDDAPGDRGVSDERYEATVQSAFGELLSRQLHTSPAHHVYPYRVSSDDQLLEFSGRKNNRELYIFLLLATRLNMQSQRIHAGINGTDLFERICCEVAKSYWGPNSSGIVFGTARRSGDNEVGNFETAVNDLCSLLREGVRFYSHSGNPPTAQDGKLDLVVWKDFTDRRNGKLIGFGQCKTGTHWKRDVYDRVPEKFCLKWVLTPPTVTPVRLYFIASRVLDSTWYDTSVDSGIVFDRCRIVDYAPPMPNLTPELSAWTAAALKASGLAIP